jgi:tetratricopeptide (TPR) repeat protein
MQINVRLLRSQLIFYFRSANYRAYIDNWEKINDDEKDNFSYLFWRFAAVSYDQLSVLIGGVAKKNFQKKAFLCIQKALKKNPHTPDVLRSAGMIQLHRNKLQKAFYFYQKAYYLNRKDPLSLIAMGNIFGAKKQYAKAITWYKKSMTYSSVKITACINIALLYSKIRDTHNAQIYAKQALILIQSNKNKTFTPFVSRMQNILCDQ